MSQKENPPLEKSTSRDDDVMEFLVTRRRRGEKPINLPLGQSIEQNYNRRRELKAETGTEKGRITKLGLEYHKRSVVEVGVAEISKFQLGDATLTEPSRRVLTLGLTPLELCAVALWLTH